MKNGPAFPVAAYDPRVFQPKTTEEEKRYLSGMDMLDYFAAKAMQGIISGHICHYGHENHWDYSALAGDAYELAKAMLKARGDEK